jgi:hypothetical protein
VNAIESVHANIALQIINTDHRASMLWVDTTPIVKKINMLTSGCNTYELRARGPLAGRIALRVYTKKCTQLVIQARGILAEEYAFTNQASWSIIKK